MAETRDFVVRPIDWSNSDERAGLRALRGKVLRPGKPPEASVYPGDDEPTTRHIGAFDSNGGIVGIATFLAEDSSTARLRGMAVEPEWQGTGVGAQIIRFAQADAREREIKFWCQARKTAIGFYERLGWMGEGDLFEIEGVGPHLIMRWTP